MRETDTASRRRDRFEAPCARKCEKPSGRRILLFVNKKKQKTLFICGEQKNRPGGDIGDDSARQG